jgi:hypothetical protein
LTASPSSLNFGSLWVGLSDTMSLTLANSGNEATQVSSISSSHGAFSALGLLPLTVPPFDTVVIPVVYQPGTEGSHSGMLTISSNAEDNPLLHVSLSGTCVRGPEISVTPAAFNVQMIPDATTTRTLTINNTGGADLEFELQVSDQQLGALRFDAGAFAAKRTAEEVARKSIAASNGKRLFPSNETKGAPKPVTLPDLRNVKPVANNNVLIFRDNLAWGYDVNVPLLTGMGANVSTASSSQMATINLDQFDVIIFESQQPQSFYTSYTASIARFEQFLYRGGIISFHTATYSSYRVPNLVLPGGMRTFATAQLEANNMVNDPTHPIVQGAPATMTGNSASHEAFENLPTGANVIVVNSLGNPTTVEYRVGNGLVLATGMTWEWGYYGGYSCGVPILPNAFAYILSVSIGPQWLSADLEDGIVPPGGNGVINFTFNSTGLAVGTYNAVLTISHNAPQDINPVVIPVTLYVGEETPGMTGGILSIGVPAVPVTYGSRFRIVNLKIGSPIAGQAQGSRYKAVLQ